jgi:hypothetical protein
MKGKITCLILLLSSVVFSQNLGYENLKQFIGNRVFELEENLQISSTKIEDNFGNQKVIYDAVQVEPYTFNMEVETEGKNIKRIIVKNTENRTLFFHNLAKEIEKTTPVKKNFKTYYISLVKNSTKKKTYQESIDHLVELLKKPTTNLKENHGLLESNALNTIITINDTESVLTIN